MKPVIDLLIDYRNRLMDDRNMALAANNSGSVKRLSDKIDSIDAAIQIADKYA